MKKIDQVLVNHFLLICSMDPKLQFGGVETSAYHEAGKYLVKMGYVKSIKKEKVRSKTFETFQLTKQALAWIKRVNLEKWFSTHSKPGVIFTMPVMEWFMAKEAA